MSFSQYSAQISITWYYMFICPLQQTIGSFDSLFMYWPSNSGNENVIFLLGKGKSKSSDQIISKVMVSHNYGRSFTEWLGPTGTRTPSSPRPLIDQIYCSTVDPKLVSTPPITYPCVCSFEMLLSDVIQLDVSLSFVIGTVP